MLGPMKMGTRRVDRGMRWRAWLLAATCGAVALCIVGCARDGARGRLLIAGGAIDPENAEVYGALMAPLAPDATIGVLPTASGVPEESVAAAMETLGRYAGSGRRVEAIDLTMKNAVDAAAPGTVAAIERCDALWFTGGDQSRIVDVFRPAEGDTPAYAAARRVLRHGGVIAGSSAGAAMMCDPMIMGGRSDDALLGRTRGDGQDSGFAIGKGMGFFPFGLVDQHFLRRGRMGRLVAALEMTGVQRGYGIDENSAIEVDLRAGTFRVVGTVLMVDVSEELRENGARRGIRVSLLHTGDVVNARTGRVSVGAKRPRVERAPVAGGSGELPEAWSASAVTLALERLARDPSLAVELCSAAFVVRFAADGRTGVHAGDGASVVDAVLEIVAR